MPRTDATKAQLVGQLIDARADANRWRVEAGTWCPLCALVRAIRRAIRAAKGGEK